MKFLVGFILFIKNVVLKLISLCLNTFLIISSIPLLFFCAVGLMMGTSPTTPDPMDKLLFTIWGLFGILGLLAFFITLFKTPGRILTIFTICGIIAVLPFVYLGGMMVSQGTVSLGGFNLDQLAELDFGEENKMKLQRLLVSKYIIISVLAAPTLFALKAIYVLIKTRRNKLLNA